MSPRLRVAIGLVVGALLAMFWHARSRSLLLHPLDSPMVEELSTQHPLMEDRGPIPVPRLFAKMSHAEMLEFGSRMSMRLAERRSLPLAAEDFKISNAFLTEAESRDPTNALWPQLKASICVRMMNYDEAAKAWFRAARKDHWSDGSRTRMMKLWDQVAANTGARLSYQGLFAMQLKTAAPAQMILRVQRLIRSHSPPTDDEIRLRFATLINFGLLRDGSRSLKIGKLANQFCLAAAAPQFPSKGESGTKAVELIRGQFVNEVRHTLGDEAADRAGREISRAVAWSAILDDEATIQAKIQTTTVTALGSNSLPSVLFVASILFLTVGLIGLALTTLLGNTPHPDRRLIVGAGALIAIGALLVSDATLVFVWAIALTAFLLVPIHAAKVAPTPWNSFNFLTLGIIGVTTYGLVLLWAFSITPSAQLASERSVYVSGLVARPDIWSSLAFVVGSMLIPCSVPWARIKSRPLLRVVGESYSRVGLTIGMIGMLLTAIITPLCVYVDDRTQPVIESWILNEPRAFRMEQPR